MLLEVQQKAYKDATELLMTTVTSRLQQLENRNQELLRSLEFTQSEVDLIKNENTKLKEDLSNLKIELIKKTDTEEKINKINDRLDYQEDYSRRNNLRFDGLEERPNESWEETQEKVQRLLREKMNLGQVELERAHRVGSRSDAGTTRPRTIVARFARFADRQQAIKKSSMLKNTQVYINEDLCESSVQARKAQIPEMKKARAEGKIAYFNHTKLIIRERREHRGDSAEVMLQQSSAVAAMQPGQRNAASASVSGAVGPVQLPPSDVQQVEPTEMRSATDSRVTRQKVKGAK